MNTMKKCSTCATMYSGDLCPQCVAAFAQKTSVPSPAPAEDLPIQLGQTFHGLEVLELLGRGGMGVVFKARQPALDRVVALKILPKKMALDPDFQGRFQREAKALGALSHPNIVAVHDFGAENGLFFFVMEFVDGANLRMVLRERKLTPDQAIRIVPQLCDALEYAHSEGVVHRDIKPENILIDRKGRVKIADFGLAKLVGADVPSQLTQTNMVMGTPHYMAPEQIENPRGVDHRADIYSMGVVFYEMLTGELPIGRFELPSKKVRIDVRLDDVVLKTLEKSPDRRYQKASDVKIDVTRATTVASVESYMPTVITPPATRRSRAGLFAGLAAVALVAIVVLIAVLTQKKPEPAPRETVEPDRGATPIEKPVDLSRIYFRSDERPLDYVLADTDKTLPRNPLPAKSPEEIKDLVRFLDALGIRNLAQSDIRQGYAIAWFRGYGIVIALDTPQAERVEQDFAALRTENRWSHRDGSLIVLVLAGDADYRQLFNDIVARVQVKLGLPNRPPDVPTGNLQFEKNDLSSGWDLADRYASFKLPFIARTAEDKEKFLGGLSDLAKLSAADVSEIYVAAFQPPDGGTGAYVSVFQFETVEKAALLEEKLRANPTRAGARKTEVLRTARTVAALFLCSDEVAAYERLARKLRMRMGHAQWSFDTAKPVALDLPPGFSFDKIQTDGEAILQQQAITMVKASNVRNAFYATLRPHGTILLLQLEDYDQCNLVKKQYEAFGAAWYEGTIVCVITAPEDDSLDALANRMRAKYGDDPVVRERKTLADIKFRDGRFDGLEIYEQIYSADGAPAKLEQLGAKDFPVDKVKEIRVWRPSSDAIVIELAGIELTDRKAADALAAKLKRDGVVVLRKDHLVLRLEKIKGGEEANAPFNRLEKEIRRVLGLPGGR